MVVSDTLWTVLSPFLFMLHTRLSVQLRVMSDLQKCSDNSANIGSISAGKEAECIAAIDNFVEWAGQNHLRDQLQEEGDDFTTTVHSGRF